MCMVYTFKLDETDRIISPYYCQGVIPISIYTIHEPRRKMIHRVRKVDLREVQISCRSVDFWQDDIELRFPEDTLIF
jgi:hypothetical protein